MLQGLLAEETSGEGCFPNFVRALRVHSVVGRWNSLHMMGRKWSQVASESNFFLSCLLFIQTHIPGMGPSFWVVAFPLSLRYFSLGVAYKFSIPSLWWTRFCFIIPNSLHWPLVSTAFLKHRSSLFTLPGLTKWYVILVSKGCRIYSTDTVEDVMGYLPLFTKYSWCIWVYV